MTAITRSAQLTVVGLVLGLALFAPRPVGAHCDTMDGPVVADAKAALENADVTPVLKWIKPEDEAEIRAAFAKTMQVRAAGPEAKELADQYFFETLVRVHRAGEGAPYTGLKPSGTDLGPAVTGADHALETGTVDELVKLVTDQVAAGIRERFADAHEKKAHAAHTVAAGREYVEAYVNFVHYVERMYLDATTETAHHGETGTAGTEGEHQH